MYRLPRGGLRCTARAVQPRPSHSFGTPREGPRTKRGAAARLHCPARLVLAHLPPGSAAGRLGRLPFRCDSHNSQAGWLRLGLLLLFCFYR
jgi:hypothetical protein